MKGSLKIWMVILGIVAAGTGITCLTNTYVTRQMEKIAETMPHQRDAVIRQQEEAVFTQQEQRADDRGQNQEEAAVLEKAEEDSVAEAVSSKDQTASAAKGADVAAVQDNQALAEVLPEAEVADLPEAEDEDLPEALADESVQENARALPADKVHTQASVLEIAEYPLNLQEALKEYQERFPQIDLQIEQMRKSETENNVYSVKNTAQTEQRIWEREMESLYRLLCTSLDEIASEKLKKEQQEWLLLRDGLAEEAAKRNSGGSLESVDYLASMAASNRKRAYELLEKYQE